MTSKEKLDKALGISRGDSVDDFLSDLELEENNSKNEISKISQDIQTKIKEVDLSLNDPNAMEDPNISIKIQQSLNDISELVGMSKKIIKHLYTDIVSSELVDSELIASTASFIQATHESIKEYIELYRDRLKFFDSLKMEMIRHQHKKEQIELKHKLDMEKIKEANPINVVPENMRSFNSEDIMEALKKMDV